MHQLQTAYEFDYTRALSNKYLSKQKVAFPPSEHTANNNNNKKKKMKKNEGASLPAAQGLRVFNNHHVRFLCKLSPLSLRLSKEGK